MLKFNKDTRTLEPEEYRYELQERKEPNLYREIFSYGEIPKTPFNWRVVPMRPAKHIWITDTTFRDGQQSMPPYTVKQISDLFDLIHRLGGRKGVIRQCEFFLYTDKDKKAVEKCLAKGYKYPEITGWIRAVKSDFTLVKKMGLRETGILTSVSDYHIYNKLKTSRRSALAMYLDIVRSALETGITPRCHFEDITRADFYGFVVPFAQELMKLAREARKTVKIRACDTLGYGVTYPGASLPRSVNGIIYGLNRLAGVPSEWLEWHGHNDFYRAVQNAADVWLYGCSAVNGSLLGIGERTGNTPTEALVIEYIALRGKTDGMDTRVITEIAEYFEKEIGYRIPPSQPFVGAHFNMTRAGIHADGLSKDEEIYNIFDTARILKRRPYVAITDKSGAAGIAYWINNYFRLEGRKKIAKTNRAVAKIRNWVDKQYQAERVTVISDEELLEQVRIHIPHLIK